MFSKKTKTQTEALEERIQKLEWRVNAISWRVLEPPKFNVGDKIRWNWSTQCTHHMGEGIIVERTGGVDKAAFYKVWIESENRTEDVQDCFAQKAD